eukprot:8760104-Prorocentrum_lima.AAC.1
MALQTESWQWLSPWLYEPSPSCSKGIVWAMIHCFPTGFLPCAAGRFIARAWLPPRFPPLPARLSFLARPR